MSRKLYYWVWLFATLFVVGCEDLEDTYDDFTDGGMIRYLGKCSDVEVSPGWQRLRVVWKNSIDAGIQYTRVTWQSELDERPFERVIEYRPDDVVADPMDTVFLEGLSDAVYTVTVTNFSADSTASLMETTYARPYTETHEDLSTFTRGIVNFYVLGDKMAVVLDEDNENLKSLTLTYWGTDQQEHEWDVKQHMSDTIELGGYNMMCRKYMRLLPENENWEGIDFSKPLTIKRQGRLTGCIDEVPFEDEVLDLNERIFSTSFTRLLTKNYGPDWENQIDRIEEIDLDYDISSFQDLLYFPNLKKVNLGKNRFMVSGHENENGSITDDYLGLMTLQFLKDTRGVEVVRYNEQYFQEEVETERGPMPYMIILQASMDIDWDLISDQYGYDANWQFMPEIEPLDTDGWEVTCSDTVYNGNKTNGAGWLLDDDATTCFEPGQTLTTTVFEVEFDMQEPQVVHGFKFVQPDPTTATTLSYLLESVSIEVSEDGYVWEQATYEEGSSTIGDALGETTFISVPDELQKPVRYIRLTMANKQTSEISGGTPLYSLRLADVVPY